MSVQPWSSSYCRFVVRHRVFVLLVLTGLLFFCASWARHLSLSSKMTDYYPSRHPHVRLYREFTEMLKMTNAVIVTVAVKQGTIYTNETLAKIHRITVDLLDTKGVNPFEVMSLTTPRLKDIRVREDSINILPVVDHPEQPQTPAALAHIKNAVYTNLGIRGVYVSPDDKVALIRAGFWEGMTEPRAVLDRLRMIAARERDAHTEVEFTGNLLLAAWLIEAAPYVLLLLLVSGIVALFFAGQMFGFLSGAILLILVSVIGGICGSSLLSVQGRSLEPFMMLALFPLSARGIALVANWQLRLARESQSVVIPFAEQEGRLRVLERTAMVLWWPLTLALGADGLALGALMFSDVPAVQALGAFGAGWIVGLLLALWVLFPLWSSAIRLRSVADRSPAWAQRLAVQIVTKLCSFSRPSLTTSLGVLVLLGLGTVAAFQLKAGREMMGNSLFYTSHPYNRAFALANKKFIGVNQLIIIAQATEESAFRNPQALQALESFQHYMAEDEQCGGVVAITSLIKSVTRMFHEDIPKWEVVPDDIDSAGQVIFRIISSAATPSEVARFLSADFRATAVTLFYRDYSPAIVDRALARAHTFAKTQDGNGVRFRLAGGVLGILAAMHAAVERNYWHFLGAFVLFTAIGAVVELGFKQAALGIMIVLLCSQAITLLFLWGGKGIDLNVYTLPVVILSSGMLLVPAFLTWVEDSTGVHPRAFAMTSLILAASAVVWLCSPLRLQAQLGVLLIILAFVHTLLPLQIKRLFDLRTHPEPTK